MRPWWYADLSTRGGGYWIKFHRFVIHQCPNTGQLLNITFIFDKCGRSSAAVTLVKYKSVLKNLKGIFAKPKILPTEKFPRRCYP